MLKMHHLIFNQQISMWHNVVFWNFERDRLLASVMRTSFVSQIL